MKSIRMRLERPGQDIEGQDNNTDVTPLMKATKCPVLKICRSVSVAYVRIETFPFSNQIVLDALFTDPTRTSFP